jgi:probable phosphomutase (TIGR03848 family)
VTTVLLVRHGRTTANADGLLAGWTPGVRLDDHGQAQAHALAERLAPVPLAAVVSSPLERCTETSAALVVGRDGIEPVIDERLGECRYGDWTGKPLRELARQKLWKVVQAYPSAAAFPGDGGEALREVQSRAVEAVRDWDERLSAEHGPKAVWVACSHGDVIKAVVADALGLHLDLFQRIVVDPGSVTAIRFTSQRPFLLRLNDVGGALSGYLPPRRRRRRASRSGGEAPVGGGTGADEAGA